MQPFGVLVLNTMPMVVQLIKTQSIQILPKYLGEFASSFSLDDFYKWWESKGNSCCGQKQSQMLQKQM